MSALIDLTGEKFNNLEVIKRSGSNKFREALWLCKCDCGNYKKATGRNLKKGLTNSCGCKTFQKLSKARSTHGKSDTPIYSVWLGMKNRCDLESVSEYKNYGGRGISVCGDWYDFERFYNWALLNGYKEGLTLDRTDNNGNYTPDNCRWVGCKVQANNRRSNRNITYKGKTKTLQQWADATGIKRGTIWARIEKYGWSIEKALTTKVSEQWKVK